MNSPESRTLENALFERMGITVDDALATGTDVLDEAVRRAGESGADVDTRLARLTGLVLKLTEPSTLDALKQLVGQLPHIVQLSRMAGELPQIAAAVVDAIDDFQASHATQGVDVEKAVANGLQAILFLGSKVDQEHLRRIGELLGSDILNSHALNVVDNAAKSLNTAQHNICERNSERIGIFGILKALRDPQIQRSLAFAVQFGRCFGRNLDQQES